MPPSAGEQGNVQIIRYPGPNNQNYTASLDGYYFNADPVFLPPGSSLTSLGFKIDQNQLCITLTVMDGNGQTQTISGAASGNYIRDSGRGCTNFYANLNPASTDQQVSGFGFTQSGNQIVFAAWSDAGYVVPGNDDNYSPSLGDQHLNINGVVMPPNVDLVGTQSFMNGNQLCLGIAVVPSA